MNLTHNTILITGGTNGIGLALAERFLKRQNTVIVCGRRDTVLEAARKKLPGLHGLICDVGQAEERQRLAEWIVREFPALNVLVNNAGIQRKIDLTAASGGGGAWEMLRDEIAINFDAPIHLSMLLANHLSGQRGAAIVNVSSGLAFTPMAAAPIYCATKAGLHSFSVSLRYQLARQAIEVIEIMPPAVNTDLGGSGQHTFGVPVDDFADAVFAGLAKKEQEIGYGSAAQVMRLSRDEIDRVTQRINQHFHT
ncbi:MAG: SDR family oxidoreductase [Phycisphaerales bacterium]|nr:SDR family oxidoreductase [Phycisphaerales bacterium]